MSALGWLIYIALITFIAACAIVIVGAVVYCQEAIRKRKDDTE